MNVLGCFYLNDRELPIPIRGEQIDHAAIPGRKLRYLPVNRSR